MDLPQNSIQQLRRMSLMFKTVGFIVFFGILFAELCWSAYSWMSISSSLEQFYQYDLLPISIITFFLIFFQIIASQLWLSGHNLSKYQKTLDVQFLNKGLNQLRWFWLILGIILLIIILIILTLILIERMRQI